MNEESCGRYHAFRSIPLTQFRSPHFCYSFKRVFLSACVLGAIFSASMCGSTVADSDAERVRRQLMPGQAGFCLDNPDYPCCHATECCEADDVEGDGCEEWAEKHEDACCTDERRMKELPYDTRRKLQRRELQCNPGAFP